MVCGCGGLYLGAIFVVSFLSSLCRGAARGLNPPSKGTEKEQEEATREDLGFAREDLAYRVILIRLLLLYRPSNRSFFLFSRIFLVFPAQTAPPAVNTAFIYSSRYIIHLYNTILLIQRQRTDDTNIKIFAAHLTAAYCTARQHLLVDLPARVRSLHTMIYEY